MSVYFLIVGIHLSSQSRRTAHTNIACERVDRKLKGQCVYRDWFGTLRHTGRIIGDWVGFYNCRRPNHALGMKTRAEAFALAT